MADRPKILKDITDLFLRLTDVKNKADGLISGTVKAGDATLLQGLTPEEIGGGGGTGAYDIVITTQEEWDEWVTSRGSFVRNTSIALKTDVTWDITNSYIFLVAYSNLEGFGHQITMTGTGERAPFTVDGFARVSNLSLGGTVEIGDLAVIIGGASFGTKHITPLNNVRCYVTSSNATAETIAFSSIIGMTECLTKGNHLYSNCSKLSSCKGGEFRNCDNLIFCEGTFTNCTNIAPTITHGTTAPTEYVGDGKLFAVIE